MKAPLTINFIILGTIVSYLLIAIRGEHLGGPLGLFLFMNLFSKEIFYGLIPVIGIVFLIIAMFINIKRALYIRAILCLYTCLILYSIIAIRNRASVDEVSTILSMFPFIIFSISLGGFVLKPPREIEK
jgi:hypothetical protein